MRKTKTAAGSALGREPDLRDRLRAWRNEVIAIQSEAGRFSTAPATDAKLLRAVGALLPVLDQLLADLHGARPAGGPLVGRALGAGYLMATVHQLHYRNRASDAGALVDKVEASERAKPAAKKSAEKRGARTVAKYDLIRAAYKDYLARHPGATDTAAVVALTMDPGGRDRPGWSEATVWRAISSKAK